MGAAAQFTPDAGFSYSGNCCGSASQQTANINNNYPGKYQPRFPLDEAHVDQMKHLNEREDHQTVEEMRRQLKTPCFNMGAAGGGFGSSGFKKPSICTPATQNVLLIEDRESGSASFINVGRQCDA